MLSLPSSLKRYREDTVGLTDDIVISHYGLSLTHINNITVAFHTFTIPATTGIRQYVAIGTNLYRITWQRGNLTDIVGIGVEHHQTAFRKVFLG